MRILPPTKRLTQALVSPAPAFHRSVISPVLQSPATTISLSPQTNTPLAKALGHLPLELQQQAVAIYHLLRLMMKNTQDLTPFKTGNFSPVDVTRKLSPLLHHPLAQEHSFQSHTTDLLPSHFPVSEQPQENRFYSFDNTKDMKDLYSAVKEEIQKVRQERLAITNVPPSPQQPEKTTIIQNTGSHLIQSTTPTPTPTTATTKTVVPEKISTPVVSTETPKPTVINEPKPKKQTASTARTTNTATVTNASASQSNPTFSSFIGAVADGFKSTTAKRKKKAVVNTGTSPVINTGNSATANTGNSATANTGNSATANTGGGSPLPPPSHPPHLAGLGSYNHAEATAIDTHLIQMRQSNLLNNPSFLRYANTHAERWKANGGTSEATQRLYEDWSNSLGGQVSTRPTELAGLTEKYDNAQATAMDTHLRAMLARLPQGAGLFSATNTLNSFITYANTHVQWWKDNGGTPEATQRLYEGWSGRPFNPRTADTRQRVSFRETPVPERNGVNNRGRTDPETDQAQASSSTAPVGGSSQGYTDNDKAVINRAITNHVPPQHRADFGEYLENNRDDWMRERSEYSGRSIVGSTVDTFADTNPAEYHATIALLKSFREEDRVNRIFGLPNDPAPAPQITDNTDNTDAKSEAGTNVSGDSSPVGRKFSFSFGRASSSKAPVTPLAEGERERLHEKYRSNFDENLEVTEEEIANLDKFIDEKGPEKNFYRDDENGEQLVHDYEASQASKRPPLERMGASSLVRGMSTKFSAMSSYRPFKKGLQFERDNLQMVEEDAEETPALQTTDKTDNTDSGGVVPKSPTRSYDAEASEQLNRPNPFIDRISSMFHSHATSSTTSSKARVTGLREGEFDTLVARYNSKLWSGSDLKISTEEDKADFQAFLDNKGPKKNFYRDTEKTDLFKDYSEWKKNRGKRQQSSSFFNIPSMSGRFSSSSFSKPSASWMPNSSSFRISSMPSIRGMSSSSSKQKATQVAPSDASSLAPMTPIQETTPPVQETDATSNAVFSEENMKAIIEKNEKLSPYLTSHPKALKKFANDRESQQSLISYHKRKPDDYAFNITYEFEKFLKDKEIIKDSASNV